MHSRAGAVGRWSALVGVGGRWTGVLEMVMGKVPALPATDMQEVDGFQVLPRGGMVSVEEEEITI